MALLLTAVIVGLIQPFCEHLVAQPAEKVGIPSSPNRSVPRQLRDGHHFVGEYSETERLRKSSIEVSESSEPCQIPVRRMDPLTNCHLTCKNRPRTIQLYGAMDHPAASPSRWRC